MPTFLPTGDIYYDEFTCARSCPPPAGAAAWITVGYETTVGADTGLYVGDSKHSCGVGHEVPDQHESFRGGDGCAPEFPAGKGDIRVIGGDPDRHDGCGVRDQDRR